MTKNCGNIPKRAFTWTVSPLSAALHMLALDSAVTIRERSSTKALAIFVLTKLRPSNVQQLHTSWIDILLYGADFLPYTI